MLIKESLTSSLESSSYSEVESVKNWLLNKVGKPDPNIGRVGEICPFVNRAHNSGSIYFAIYTFDDIEYHQFEKEILDVCSYYLELKNTIPSIEKDLFSIIVVIKGLPPEKYEQYIDHLHYMNRLHFMNKGLMLGEFHPLSVKPAARNKDFHPLKSPVPCFAIRKLTQHDIMFINDNKDNIIKRKKELELYVEKNEFGPKKKAVFVEMIDELE